MWFEGGAKQSFLVLQLRIAGKSLPRKLNESEQCTAECLWLIVILHPKDATRGRRWRHPHGDDAPMLFPLAVVFTLAFSVLHLLKC
jgi:hypothetical protein